MCLNIPELLPSFGDLHCSIHCTQLPIFSPCYHYLYRVLQRLHIFIQSPASCIRVTILIDHSYPACLKNSNNTFYYLFIYLHIFIEPTFQLDNIYICHLNFIYYLHFAWINQVCNGSISTEEECPRPVRGSVVRRPRRLHFWTWTIYASPSRVLDGVTQPPGPVSLALSSGTRRVELSDIQFEQGER